MSSVSVDGLVLGDFLRARQRVDRRVAFVITGGAGAGKTTALKEFLSACASYGLGVGADGSTDRAVAHVDYFSLTETFIAANGDAFDCLVLDDIHLWIQLRKANSRDYNFLSEWRGHLVASCPSLECIPPSVESAFVVVEYPIMPSQEYILRRVREAHPTHSKTAACLLSRLTPRGITTASLMEHVRTASAAASQVSDDLKPAAFEEMYASRLGSSRGASRLPTLPTSLRCLHDRAALLLGQHLSQHLDGDAVGAVSRVSASTSGILLTGVSGSGKTLLTHTLEAAFPSVPFVRACSNEFFAKYLGESEERLRNFFRRARQLSPCVVVLEDIDVLGQRRSEGSEGSGVGKRILTALLCELDGVEDSTGFLVIGTTSAVTTIDGALLRQGRLETVLEVPSLTSGDVLELLNAKRDLMEMCNVLPHSFVNELCGQPLSHFSKAMRHLLESTI